MDDDDTTESQEAAEESPPATDRPANEDDGSRGGVRIPQWLAAALVVVLGIAVGGAGFAIGRATDDGGGGRPALAGFQCRAPDRGGPGGQRGEGGPPGFGGQNDNGNDNGGGNDGPPGF
jgi:hypothetical protein